MARRPIIIPFIKNWCEANPGQSISVRALAMTFIEIIDKETSIPTFTCYVNGLANSGKMPRDARYDIQRPAPGEPKTATITSTAWTPQEVAIFIDGLFHGFWPNRQSALADAVREGWPAEPTFGIRDVRDADEHHAMLDEFEKTINAE